ncbi:hypothetical protein ACI6Q2_12980 [Chitinophagaceae bacterium LWZ2-11]
MIKQLCLLILLVSTITAVSAQKISLTGFGGYTFRDRVDFANGYFGYLNDGGHWGASIEAINRAGRGIDLTYNQQNTTAPVYNNFGQLINPNNQNITISYLTLGLVEYFPVNQVVSPYGGFGMGIGIVGGATSATRFAWDIKGGLKVKASRIIGIKLQAQLASIVQGGGAGFYFGTGGGGVSYATYSSVLQFGFTGGLCFDLK